jgi:hypothetical protein
MSDENARSGFLRFLSMKPYFILAAIENRVKNGKTLFRPMNRLTKAIQGQVSFGVLTLPAIHGFDFL